MVLLLRGVVCLAVKTQISVLLVPGIRESSGSAFKNIHCEIYGLFTIEDAFDDFGR